MATLTPAQVYALARSTGLARDAAIVATAIAGAESGYDTEAVGDESLVDSRWGPSIGLWQIRSTHADRGTGRARDATRLTDPAFNAQSMHSISNGGTNWQPWSAYTNGRYRHPYLLDATMAADGAGDHDSPLGALDPNDYAADLLADPASRALDAIGLGWLLDTDGLRKVAVVLAGALAVVAGVMILASNATPAGAIARQVVK